MKKLIRIVLFIFIILSCKNQAIMNPGESGYLSIDDSKIYYEIFGKGEPIILIHAGVTDSRMWNYQIEDLSENFKVIRFDQRGFGKSSIPENSYNPVLDIIRLMDSCKLSKVNLVGISLGALQAIDLAIEYPERVKTLIISGTGIPDWPQPQDVLEKHIEFTHYVYENGPDSAVKRILTDPFWSKSMPGRKYTNSRKLYEKILYENKHSFTVDWQLRKLPLGLADRLEHIECPVLLFRPENEMPSLIPIADTIARKVSSIKIAEMPAASHLVNMERPDEFNRILIEFITNNQ